MTRTAYPELETATGTFTDLGAEKFELVTVNDTYRISLVRGFLSRTESITVMVKHSRASLSFDLIRTYTKTGCRVNAARVGSWKAPSSAEALALAVEALTRHYVARFERCNPALFAS